MSCRVILVAVSRVGGLARRPWMLLLLAPIAFVACYLGICAAVDLRSTNSASTISRSVGL
jgi:hypothetical protein